MSISSMQDPSSSPLEKHQSSADRNGDLDSGGSLFPKRVWPFEVLTCIFPRMFRKHWGSILRVYILLVLRSSGIFISIWQLES